MKHEVSALWTGSYPSLCFGEWVIVIDGIQLTGLGDSPFGIYGSYSSWSFGEDWDENWESYKSGLQLDEWIKCPPNGLLESLARHGIEASTTLMEQLYDEIGAQDWRHGSCGGCI